MKTTKKTTIWTLMLMLLAACSQSEVVTTYEQEAVKMPPSSTFSDIPVAFDVNDGEQAQTRVLTTEQTLKASEETGFGVFAYYTHGDYPVPNNDYYPNFMYNQHVYWHDNAYWKYSPLKYWPNDYSSANGGAVDNEGATGAGAQDRVSFFAYGPYVKCDPSTGKALNDKTDGIIEFETNDKTGDPRVHYAMNGEDLVYAKRMNQYKGQDGSLEQAFEFKHALAGIMFQVGANFDEQVGGQIDSETYISIEEVKIETTLATISWFNLNTQSWEDSKIDPGAYFLVTADNINKRLMYRPTATNKYVYDPTENPISYDHDGEVAPGVGRDEHGEVAAARTIISPLMEPVNGIDQYAVIIPVNESRNYKVTCTYHVWTFDPRNADGITKVKNKITNTVSLPSLELGKWYTITMWLGMRSVELEAAQYQNGQGPDASRPEFWPSSLDTWTEWKLPT